MIIKPKGKEYFPELKMLVLWLQELSVKENEDKKRKKTNKQIQTKIYNLTYSH